MHFVSEQVAHPVKEGTVYSSVDTNAYMPITSFPCGEGTVMQSTDRVRNTKS